MKFRHFYKSKFLWSHGNSKITIALISTQFRFEFRFRFRFQFCFWNLVFKSYLWFQLHDNSGFNFGFNYSFQCRLQFQYGFQFQHRFWYCFQLCSDFNFNFDFNINFLLRFRFEFWFHSFFLQNTRLFGNWSKCVANNATPILIKFTCK